MKPLIDIIDLTDQEDILTKIIDMTTEKVYNGIRYTLSNEGLKEGDKVYPIARGRCLDDGGWILHDFDFKEYSSGFPDEPHTIIDLNHSGYKPYQVRTDFGYGPIEKYYKVVKKEVQVEQNPNAMFKSYIWVEA